MTNHLSLVADREPTACFSVTADNNPATLPRVLEVFAKLGRAPHQCYATAYGDDLDDLHIDLQYRDMTHAEAEHLACVLRGLFLVKTVLMSEKIIHQVA